MYSSLTGQQVILWGDSSLGTKFLKIADWGLPCWYCHLVTEKDSGLTFTGEKLGHQSSVKREYLVITWDNFCLFYIKSKT